LFPRRSAAGILERGFRTPFEFGDLLGREFIINSPELNEDFLRQLVLFRWGQPPNLLQDFCCAHVANISPLCLRASEVFKPLDGPAMIPREILRKLRQIEMRCRVCISSESEHLEKFSETIMWNLIEVFSIPST